MEPAKPLIAKLQAKLKPMMPALEPEGLEMLREQFARCQSYLEYGCGGSTVEAARAGVRQVVSVDNVRDWIDKVLAQVRNHSATCRLVFCDLGPVREVGYPSTAKHFDRFHLYPMAPWDVAKAAKIVPDLVLVDGRFRVACFLYTLACAAPGTTILFDDYFNRPHYHVVTEFLAPVRSAGRMALFEVPGPLCTVSLMRRFAQHCAGPG